MGDAVRQDAACGRCYVLWELACQRAVEALKTRWQASSHKDSAATGRAPQVCFSATTQTGLIVYIERSFNASEIPVFTSKTLKIAESRVLDTSRYI